MGSMVNPFFVPEALTRIGFGCTIWLFREAFNNFVNQMTHIEPQFKPLFDPKFTPTIIEDIFIGSKMLLFQVFVKGRRDDFMAHPEEALHWGSEVFPSENDFQMMAKSYLRSRFFYKID